MAYGAILGQQAGVQSVNKLIPDENGNVELTNTDVNALANESLSVKTANIDNGAVTEEKISTAFKNNLDGKYAPSITASTQDLTSGVSFLTTGHLYVVYE